MVVDRVTEAKYIKRLEEGYNIYDTQYYKWLKFNHPLEAVTWIKSAVGREQLPDAGPVTGKGVSSGEIPGPLQTRGTDVSSGEIPGPSRMASEGLNYISRFLVQVIPGPKEKSDSAPKRISGGRAFTSAECIKLLEQKEIEKQKAAEEKQKKKEKENKNRNK